MRTTVMVWFGLVVFVSLSQQPKAGVEGKASGGWHPPVAVHMEFEGVEFFTNDADPDHIVRVTGEGDINLAPPFAAVLRVQGNVVPSAELRIVGDTAFQRRDDRAWLAFRLPDLDALGSVALLGHLGSGLAPYDAPLSDTTVQIAQLQTARIAVEQFPDEALGGVAVNHYRVTVDREQIQSLLAAPPTTLIAWHVHQINTSNSRGDLWAPVRYTAEIWVGVMGGFPYQVHALTQTESTTRDYTFQNTPLAERVSIEAPSMPIRVGPTGEPARPPDGAIMHVVSVLNGDTIEVEDQTGTRFAIGYLGVDAPEEGNVDRPAACYGAEARSRNATLVIGQQVRLERDAIVDVDSIGLPLRYVYLDDHLVNAALVADGAARFVPLDSSALFMNADKWDALREAERAAREGRHGLWAVCAGDLPPPSAFTVTVLDEGGRGDGQTMTFETSGPVDLCWERRPDPQGTPALSSAAFIIEPESGRRGPPPGGTILRGADGCLTVGLQPGRYYVKAISVPWVEWRVTILLPMPIE